MTFTPVGKDGGDADSASGGDSSTDGQGSTDGPDPDAIVTDAGRKLDPDACAADACDCDDDGFRDKSKPFCQVDGSPGDCDDTDSRYKPSQGLNYEVPEGPLGGDWNCNGTVEKHIPPKIKCEGTNNQNDCQVKYGFTDDPGCGLAGGRYVTCSWICGLPIIGCECRENGPPKIDVKQACK